MIAAQEKANVANAAVSSAQTAYDEASGKLGDLTNKYNTAKAAYDQAQQIEADKKAAYDQAVKDRDDKRAEYKAACDAADAAEAASDAASAEVDKLEQQIAELKSNMTVDQDIINNGMLGFMAYISNGSDFTAQQKDNASAASSMLTGAPNTNQRYDKASWYDSYVDQDMSRDTNPLSLEQLRNAMTAAGKRSTARPKTCHVETGFLAGFICCFVDMTARTAAVCADMNATMSTVWRPRGATVVGEEGSDERQQTCDV